MAKTRVAVLRGGVSDEFDISLRTGEHVISMLSREKYEPIDVVITRSGEWLSNGRARTPHDILLSADVAFNALHGAYGEDGQVQRLFDRVGVPYTGSRAYPSLLAINKAIAKDHLRETGILLPKHLIVGRSALRNSSEMASSISRLFGPQYIVKPLTGGSSLGIVYAGDQHELAEALHSVLQISEQALVEEFIDGREASCVVVERFRNEALYALPVAEVFPRQGAQFYGYDAKYDASTASVRCPSSFSLKERRTLEGAARTVHTTLGLSHYSSSDFMVTPKGIYFLEVDSLPALASEALLSRSLDAVGIEQTDFIEHLLTQALEPNR